MLNKRLLKAFPDTFPYISRNIFFQWISLLASSLSTIALCVCAASIFGTPSLSVWNTALLVLACLIVRQMALKMASRASFQAAALVRRQLRERLFDKLSQLGSSYRNRWSTSEISQLTSEGVEQLEVWFGQYLPQFFYALLAPLTLFLIVGFLYWPAALVLFVCVPLIPVSIIAVQKFAKKLLSCYWDQYTGLSDDFLENLQGLTTLKLYGTDGLYHEKMNRQAENFRRITMRVLIMQLNSISVMDLVAYGGSALGMGMALYGCLHGQIGGSTMLSIILLSAEFFLPMRTLGSYFHISMNGSAAADKMFAILDTPVQDGSEELCLDSAFPALDIEARDLSFTYPEATKPALEHVSFSLQGNGLYGIAGESGSGKSTLASLLYGRLRFDDGTLTLNDQPLESLSRKSLARHLGVLNSQPVLFAGTVRENLCGSREIDDPTLIEILRKTLIWPLIQKRGGLDFVLEEGGSNLSGGQKQRLAFARLLSSEPSALLLDEATSSIDAASEAILVHLIEEFSKEHPVFFITHHLSNVKRAKQILVFAHGKLVEQGRFEDLKEAGGEFERIYSAQQKLEQYVKGESLYEREENE